MMAHPGFRSLPSVSVIVALLVVGACASAPPNLLGSVGGSGPGPGDASDDSDGLAGAVTTLRAAADGAGRLIGAAIGTYHFSEDAYRTTVGQQFNFLTPENEMKWDATEPSQNGFSFTAGDQLVTFGQANQMKIKGHALVWYQALPPWVSALPPDQVKAAMINHVTKVVTHFKGKVAAWDVVNEAINDGSSTYRPSLFFTALGETYIDDAFKAARAADPDVKLYYNDYDGEALGVKSDGIYNLVKRLKDAGVPIDGVGLQMHLDPRSLPSLDGIKQNMARLVALGLTINISEMDVPVGSVTGDLATKFARQAQIYHDVIAVCVAQPACGAITFWGVTDKYSWLNDPQFMFRGPGPHYPLPFDDAYQAKPAVPAIEDALLGR